VKFENEMVRIQWALTKCLDSITRRVIVIDALQPRSGEKILEVGCGAGFYAAEVAQCVGPTGHLTAIDISADQITAAREHCSGLDWVSCEQINVVDLRYPAASFDAVFGVQVFDYLPDVGEGLRQVYRVLRPGGRVLIYATSWSSIVWYSHEPERMKRVLEEWNQHAPYPSLPMLLPKRLRSAGFTHLRQQPVPLLNMSYHANSYSYWAAHLIKKFVAGTGQIEAGELDAWLDEFDALEAQGAYYFCYTPVMTTAIKPAG
jgi:arsenite methyltransferase